MFLLTGWKRLIAAILLPIIEVLKSIPGTAEIIQILEALAAFFGLTGIAHAAKTRSLTKKNLATAAALLAILIEVAQLFPGLQPYVPLLQQIAAILGSLAAGAAVGAARAAK